MLTRRALDRIIKSGHYKPHSIIGPPPRRCHLVIDTGPLKVGDRIRVWDENRGAHFLRDATQADVDADQAQRHKTPPG